MTGEIVYRLTAADKPGDPADKATDATADGAFGGVQTHNHRAGYGDDKLERLIDYLGRHPRATLASGEGLVLVAHIGLVRADLAEARAEIDRLRAAAKDSADHYADARAEIDRLTRILAALREPSEAVLLAAEDAMDTASASDCVPGDWNTSWVLAAIRAAIAAAEQEVGNE